jgi:glycine/D-amino acid oxidase-like deaminating enzyme
MGDRRGGVAALVVAAILAWPHAQRYTGAEPSAQFYQKVQLEPTLDRDYKHVLGVAHNAGNNLGTLAKALRYGADVIEFDVISARGRLVAGRNQPLPRLARQVFRGRPWPKAGTARRPPTWSSSI